MTAAPKMTRHIAITNRKGGTGKTTTAVNLSVCLQDCGRFVDLIDCDDQQHARRWLGRPVLPDISGAIEAARSSRADYVLYDCPPAVSRESVAAIMQATDILVPVETSPLALQGLGDLLAELADVRPDLGVPLVLFCRADGREAITRELIDMVRGRRGIHVLDTVIRTNVRLKEAFWHNEPITQYAPKSRGAADYRALAQEIEELCESR
jgi:chromosome partitioning protein